MSDQANAEYAKFINTLYDGPQDFKITWYQRRGMKFYQQYRKEKLEGFWDTRQKPTYTIPQWGVDKTAIYTMEEAYLKSLPYFH